MTNLWIELSDGIATYPLLYLLWGVVGLSWLGAAGLLLVTLARRRTAQRVTTLVKRRGAHPLARLGRMLADSLGQLPIWRVPLAGLMHAGLFGGGALLVTAFVATHFLWPRGQPWQQAAWVHSVNDVGMILALLGLTIAGGRRLARALPASGVDTALWGLLLAADLLALLSYALLVAIAQPQWRAQAWVSHALAGLLVPLGKATLRTLYGWSWAMLHGLVWAGALLVPWTKWRHALLTPLSLLARRGAPLARLEALDLAGEGPFGAQHPQDLTRQEELGLLACTRCGRCAQACPAQSAGRALDPLALLETLQTAGKQLPLAEQVGEGVLWDCTTCMACEEVCPVGISPLAMIMDLRRERVLDAAALPMTLRHTLRGLEQQGNPWGLARAERERWVATLGLPILGEGESCEVLLWLGCMGSYDARARQTLLALLRLLRSAGVSVAILGAVEQCCGDPARRSGNEYLWHKLAEQNAAALRARRFTRLVSLCPHCINTLGNEYGDLGIALPAIHATAYLAELLEAGRLRLEAPPQAPLRLTYHDPCYLGRGNGVYAAPRRLLAALPHVQLVELAPHGRAARCCGGGGGQLWLGKEGLAPLEAPRAQDVLRASGDACATACPYCATMLTDGLAVAQSALAVRDVIELLADGLPQNSAAATRSDIGV